MNCSVCVIIIAFFNFHPFYLGPGIVYILKVCAIGECRISNACNTVWNGNTRQACAVGECRIFNACNTVWNGYTRQACAVVECFAINVLQFASSGLH